MAATQARFDGVAVRDKELATLLSAALAQGFRMEAATNGGHARDTGLVAYSPDTTLAPVRFGCQSSNPGHLANVRRDLRNAGFIDAQTIARSATPQEPTPMSKQSKIVIPTGSDRYPDRFDDHASGTEWISKAPDEAEKALRVGLVAQHAAKSAGLSAVDASTISVVVDTLVSWLNNPQVIAERGVPDNAAETEAALAMAATAEQRALTAEGLLAKAVEKEAQARKDCGLALDRAKTAEARAETLDAALRPLRSLLAGTA